MKRKCLSIVLVLTVLPWLLLAPGQAFGQGATWAGVSLARMVEEARWRVGELRVNGTISLSNAGYDSDIFYGFLPESVPDYTFSAGTTVQVLLPLSKQVVLDVSDSPQYLFYYETKNERAWNNTFRGKIHIALNRVYVQLGGGSSNVRYRLSPELNINVRQKQDALDGLILWKVSKGASLSFVYGGARYEYGDAEFGGMSLSDALNRKEDFFDLITYVEPSPKVRLFLDGQYATYAFSRPISQERDARSYGAFGGIEFVPKTGERLGKVGIVGNLRLGYQRLDIVDTRFADGSGFTGAADVSVTFMTRNSVRAFFSRGFQFSVFAGTSYFLSTTYGGGITRLLSRRISFSYNISFGQTSYPGNGAGGTLEGVRNLYTMHSLGLNFRLARHLELALLGTLGTRSLDRTSPARSRNFLGFSLVYGFPGGGMQAPGGGLRR